MSTLGRRSVSPAKDGMGRSRRLRSPGAGGACGGPKAGIGRIVTPDCLPRTEVRWFDGMMIHLLLFYLLPYRGYATKMASSLTTPLPVGWSMVLCPTTEMDLPAVLRRLRCNRRASDREEEEHALLEQVVELLESSEVNPFRGVFVCLSPSLSLSLRVIRKRAGGENPEPVTEHRAGSLSPGGGTTSRHAARSRSA